VKIPEVFRGMPEEKAIKESKERESHMCFQVGVGQVHYADEQQEKPEKEVFTVIFPEDRQEYGHHDVNKSDESEFDQVVEVLVVGRSLVFG